MISDLFKVTSEDVRTPSFDVVLASLRQTWRKVLERQRGSLMHPKQVLGCYRLLLRTRTKLFAGDYEALEKSKLKIKEAFIAQKHLTEHEDILEQIKVARETDTFLKEGVLQGVLSEKENIYHLKINETTRLHDNVPLKDINVVDLKNYKIPERFKEKS